MDSDTIINMLSSTDEQDFILGKELLKNNIEIGLFTPEELIVILDEVWWKMVTKKEIERYQELNRIVTEILMKFSKYKESD